jgi:hypothetical protein
LSVLCPRPSCVCTCTRTCTCTVSLPVPLYTRTHLLSPRNRNPITNPHPASPSSTAIHRTSTASSRCQPTIRHQSKAQTGCSAEKHPLMLRKTCNGTDRGNFRTRTQPARQLPLACLIAVPRCFDPCIGDGHVRLNDALALSTTAVSLGSSVWFGLQSMHAETWRVFRACVLSSRLPCSSVLYLVVLD